MTHESPAAAPGARDDAPRATARSARPDDAQKARGETTLAARTITINRRPAEVCAFRRDFSNLSSDSKSDPADVAKDGWDALFAGKGSIVSGWKNKVQAALANVTPASILAGQHRKMAEPGSANT